MISQNSTNFLLSSYVIWKVLISIAKNLMRKSGALILSKYCKLYVKDLHPPDFIWKDP
jgi:hypothetical protein